jgi:hypothetical protein
MSRNRAILGASLVAIAATSAWMTLGASSPMSKPSPVAQAQSQPAPQPQPVPQAAPAQAPAAQTTTATPAAKPATSTPASTSAPMPAGTAAQQAHIDPKTGQLRQIEHDDAAKLPTPGAARRAARTAAAEPQQFATENAVGVAVPDEVLPYTVATVTPDGKVVLEHVQGGKAAADKVKANSSKKGLSHRKEEPNDR